MKNRGKSHKKDTLQRIVEKYGISEEDLHELEEDRDFLTTGIIIVLFAIPAAIIISGFFR